MEADFDSGENMGYIHNGDGRVKGQKTDTDKIWVRQRWAGRAHAPHTSLDRV